MTFLLNRELAEILFEGFFIQRWNDRLRPIPLVEADKNGNKMMLTLFIGKYLEGQNKTINWLKIADKGMYDALIKLALKDMSSAFHAELRKDRENYSSSLKSILGKQYGKIFANSKFLDDFQNYVEEERREELTIEDEIIRLSHNIAVKQEYKIIEAMGYGSVFLDHEESVDDIESKITKSAKILGIEDYIASDEFGLIKQLIDRLRYQVRWSQTPRIPPTNVLGHSFYVASATYFATRYTISAQRSANNFFAALMHDFLESLTRDIISPVKNSTPEFKAQIGRIELRMLDENLIPKLNKVYSGYFKYLLTEEFSNRALINSKMVLTSENSDILNEESYIDGSIVLAADYFAALLEAHQSIDLGISTHHLVGSIARLFSTIGPMSQKFSPDTQHIHQGFKDLYEDFISR